MSDVSLAPESAAKAAPAETNVFISYSRRDGEVAERLRDRLIARGIQAYLDKHDIGPGEDWRGRLGSLIESADVVAFLISPDSIASKICDWEVNHAELLGKRIIPVVCRDPADENVPERLRRLNYVFMRNPAEEESGLARLEAAIAVDIAWIRTHTRYGELALEWDRAGRPDRLLLRGTGIGEAEAWRDRRPHAAPALTEAQSAYLAGSRHAATRRQRFWISGSATVAVVSIGLAVFAFIQQRAAETSRRETTQVLATSDFRQGSLLMEAAETSPDGVAFLSRAARSGDGRARTRLWTMLQQRSFWLPGDLPAEPVTPPTPPAPPPVPQKVLDDFASVELDGQPVAPASIAVSGDGAFVFTALGEDEGVQYAVWKSDRTPVTGWIAPYYTGVHRVTAATGYLSHDGRYLAVRLDAFRDTSYFLTYDLREGRLLGGPVPASGLLPFYESVGFRSVQMFERPGSDEPDVYLLTASAKGDASLYQIVFNGLALVAANRHRSPVSFVAIDDAHEWLISSADDGTTHVTSLSDGELVGTHIQVEGKAEWVKRAGDRLVVEMTGGERRSFTLKPATTRTSAGLPASVPALDPCLTGENIDWDETAIDHPSGLRIALSGPRRISLSKAGADPILSPDFGAAVRLACASHDGTYVMVTTANFRTEIWTADFARRHGQTLDERPLFDSGVPAQTDWIRLSADGSKALMRSSIWVGPNLDTYWITLWDVASGISLIDRVRGVDDEMTDQGAVFDPATGDIIYVAGTTPLRSIEIEAPESARAWLPDLSEAAMGRSIADDGLARTIEDRPAKLADGFGRLESLGN